MNISNFITWWIQQFINIGTNMLAKLDQIILIGNVSLMDFIITIVIIEAFIGVILTLPKAVGREVRKTEK